MLTCLYFYNLFKIRVSYIFVNIDYKQLIEQF